MATMLAILLGGCAGGEAGVVDSGGGEAAVTEIALAWGDLHAHTNLSHDGCEDPTAWCVPAGRYPGETVLAEAAAHGLDFVAITDHAEYERYQRPAEGIDIDIWTSAAALVASSGGGPVLAILGYEHTATYSHRTVLLSSPDACRDFRLQWDSPRAPKDEAGLEVYVEAGEHAQYASAAALVAELDRVASLPACEGTRWLSFVHHPAYVTPADTRWHEPDTRAATDTVVEIASEHGSSECAVLDGADEGCAWGINEATWNAEGTVHAAFAAGERLGFVGGTDNHEASPGRLGEGPGHAGQFEDSDGDGNVDSAVLQFRGGAITGVFHAAGEFDTSALFDAIEARRTVAASFKPTQLELRGWVGGTAYLPGDDVPPGDLSVDLVLEADGLERYELDLVDPLEGSTSSELSAGDVRYARVRAWIDGEEERIWASPWFATE